MTIACPNAACNRHNIPVKVTLTLEPGEHVKCGQCGAVCVDVDATEDATDDDHTT